MTKRKCINVTGHEKYVKKVAIIRKLKPYQILDEPLLKALMVPLLILDWQVSEWMSYYYNLCFFRYNKSENINTFLNMLNFLKHTQSNDKLSKKPNAQYDEKYEKNGLRDNNIYTIILVKLQERAGNMSV